MWRWESAMDTTWKASLWRGFGRIINSGEVPFAELLIISLCHVQEHGAQLNMFLGQQADRTPTSKSSDLYIDVEEQMFDNRRISLFHL
jgi:hypothetical protein